MAARYPSPNSSRPKTPDISNSLRKSKEIPQRSSLSKPSSLSPRASFEQKENVRSRSPAVSSFKGSKNFMTPTISAASKAIAASPRKKILQERNEVINSSVSDSVGFSMKEVGVGVEVEQVGPNLEVGFGFQEVSGGCELKKGEPRIKNNQNLVEIEEIGLKSEMGFGSQEVLGSGELRKGEPRITNHQNVIVPSVLVSPLPFIAPLDAVPSLPPYDPKTNFLSPRPQFLHYRPNPRIEPYLNGEGGFLDVENGRRLEDIFSSESSEDDDVTVLTEEKESVEESFPAEVEEVESPSETFVSEPELKPEPLKRRPFRRSKLAPFLLVLVMACLYAPLSDAPIISSSMLEDQTFPKFYIPPFEVFEDLRLRDYLAATNGDLHGLPSKFKHWSAAIAYFTSMASLPKDDVGLYHLADVMTSLAVDETTGLELSYKPETETKQAIEENLVEEMSFTVHESEVSEVVEEGDAEYSVEKMEMEILDEITELEYAESEDEKTDEMMVSETGKEGETDACEDVPDAGSMGDLKDEMDKIGMVAPEDLKEAGVGAQVIEMEVSEDDVIDAVTVGYVMEKEVTEDDGWNELEQEASPISYEALHGEEEINTEIGPEPEIIVDEGDSNDINVIDNAQSASSVGNQLEFSEEYQISRGLELPKLMNYATMIGSSLALLLLPATMAFLYMKQRQAPMVLKERQITKKVGSVSGSSETYIHGKGFPSQNLQWNEEMIGDAGPSEMSSSWNKTSSSDQRLTKRDKEQDLSNERSLRRDSTASSTSYGSFTTYERLSTKKGCRDEEVATPVRRSGRVRNLVTSP